MHLSVRGVVGKIRKVSANRLRKKRCKKQKQKNKNKNKTKQVKANLYVAKRK